MKSLMTRKDSTERHKQKVLPLKAVKVEWPYNTNCHVEKSKKKWAYGPQILTTYLKHTKRNEQTVTSR